MKSDLHLAMVAHKPTKAACERWHYSKMLPTGKLVRIGVWEDGRFIGVVIFSRGASPWIQYRWGLVVTEICELTRIALRSHRAPVSRIIRIALKILRETNPGLRLVLSFADPSHGHHGGIYQASNWVYTGDSMAAKYYYVRGRWRHPRGSYHEMKRSGREIPFKWVPGKHRYCFALDKSLQPLLEQNRVADLPKRVKPSGEATGSQPVEGGSIPTHALQESTPPGDR